MIPRSFPRTLALLGAASLLALLLHQPAQAHGLAQSGVAAGFFHPLTGADHLLLLIGVGAAASCLRAQLLFWGLAGACAGAGLGAFGATLPAQELLAALATTAVALLVLGSQRSPQGHGPAGFGGWTSGFVGCLVAISVAMHALLHGQEAAMGAATSLWWLGAFSASLLVSGGTFLLLHRLPRAWTRGVGTLLALGGGVTVLGAVGMLAA